jgi:Txe/YoeB family toxin of Txe-Axe toxin-antitoxin module
MLFRPKYLKPFTKFFNHIRPEDFAYLFQGELISTVSFILSFCHKKSFIKKVLREWNNDEISNSVSKYLATCTEIHFDADLTRQIEIYCDKLIELYKDTDAVKGFRKNITGIIPNHPYKEQKYVDTLKQDLESITKIIKNIDNHFFEHLKALEKTNKENTQEGYRRKIDLNQLPMD